MLTTALMLLAVPAATPQTPAPKPPAPAVVRPRAPRGLAPGETLPADVTLSGLDGRSHRLDRMLGKVTVVNFYSPTSESQARWRRRLVALEDELRAEGVTFLHVVSNDDETGSPEAPAGPQLRRHLQEVGAGLRLLVDEDHRLADLLGAETTPHVFVFGSDRKLVYRGLVDDDEHDRRPTERREHLREALRAALRGEPAPTQVTEPVGDVIRRAARSAEPERRTRFVDTTKGAAARASAEGRLLLYHFSGFNCASCRVLQELMAKDRALPEALREGYVEVLLHCDARAHLSEQQFAENVALQRRLAGTLAVPALVAVDPAKDEVVATFTLTGSWDEWAGRLRRFLEETSRQNRDR